MYGDYQQSRQQYRSFSHWQQNTNGTGKTNMNGGFCTVERYFTNNIQNEYKLCSFKNNP
jgi:hypothetical protein